MSIAENLLSIKNTYRNNTGCCFQTKPIADLMEAYDADQRIFWQQNPGNGEVNGSKCPKIFQ
jgi:hypothetical protein